MMPELDGLALRVVAALCNGVYQGVLFTLVVALVLRYLRRANAATRYVLELIALAIVAALPLVHFLAGSRSTAVGREPAIMTAAGLASQEPALTPALSRRTGEGARRAGEGASPRFMATEQVPKEQGTSLHVRAGLTRQQVVDAAAPGAVTVPTNRALLAAAPEAADAEDVTLGGVIESRPPEPGPARPASVGRHWQMTVPGTAAVVVLVGWVVFAGWRLIGLLWQYAVLWRPRRSSTPVPEPLAEMFAGLRYETGLRRRVGFHLSSELT